jgi:hypothetical protein
MIDQHHLWAIRKKGQQLDCELRDHGEWGVEVQIHRETGISLWPALADEEKAAYLRDAASSSPRVDSP